MCLSLGPRVSGEAITAPNKSLMTAANCSNQTEIGKIIPIKIPGRWRGLFYKRKPRQGRCAESAKDDRRYESCLGFFTLYPRWRPFLLVYPGGWPWFSFGKNLTKFWIILPNLLFASLPRCLRCILTSLAPPLHILKASAKLTWKCERRQNKLKKIEV